MNKHIQQLAAALAACAIPAWAVATELPTHEIYSAAADSGTNPFFGNDPTYTPLRDTTSTPGATAQINGTDYTASASTTLGSNHAYVSASTTPSNILSAGSFSGWYDQVTITGGTGTGTAYFTVQLNSTVDVGALGGGLGYTLGTSSLHPSQLVSNTLTFNTSGSYAWPMDAVNPIATYRLGASPYNDTSILFSNAPTPPTSGGIIPSIPEPPPGSVLGSLPPLDRILTPGNGQAINVTLQGTLTFTYGEAFYLISGLGVSVFGEGLESFCSFNIGGSTCTSQPKDGTGATTLDFSHSANLVNIALPQGAAASFASGNVYNVTAVPEPAEWLTLLAGLALVGWRARRKTA